MAFSMQNMGFVAESGLSITEDGVCSNNTVKHFCVICDIPFAQLSIADQDKLFSNKENPYTCDVCYKSFPFPVHLCQHRLKHAREDPCFCDICGDGFMSLSSQKRHMWVHTEEPCQCGICGQFFVLASSLKQHYSIHTEGSDYICEMCGKHLALPFSLCQHRLMHRRDKLYKCGSCYKSFKRSHSLQQHKSVHEKDAMYAYKLRIKVLRSFGELSSSKDRGKIVKGKEGSHTAMETSNRQVAYGKNTAVKRIWGKRNTLEKVLEEGSASESLRKISSVGDVCGKHYTYNYNHHEDSKPESGPRDKSTKNGVSSGKYAIINKGSSFNCELKCASSSSPLLDGSSTRKDVQSWCSKRKCTYFEDVPDDSMSKSALINSSKLNYVSANSPSPDKCPPLPSRFRVCEKNMTTVNGFSNENDLYDLDHGSNHCTIGHDGPCNCTVDHLGPCNCIVDHLRPCNCANDHCGLSNCKADSAVSSNSSAVRYTHFNNIYGHFDGMNDLPNGLENSHGVITIKQEDSLHQSSVSVKKTNKSSDSCEGLAKSSMNTDDSFEKKVVEANVCDICGEKFPRLTSVGPHKLVRRGGKLYLCDASSNILRHPTSIVQHKVMKHMRNSSVLLKEIGDMFLSSKPGEDAAKPSKRHTSDNVIAFFNSGVQSKTIKHIRDNSGVFGEAGFSRSKPGKDVAEPCKGYASGHLIKGFRSDVQNKTVIQMGDNSEAFAGFGELEFSGSKPDGDLVKPFKCNTANNVIPHSTVRIHSNVKGHVNNDVQTDEFSKKGFSGSHPNEDIQIQYKCDVCETSFPSLSKILKHRKLCHEVVGKPQKYDDPNMKYRCPNCKSCFRKPSDLSLHQETHSGYHLCSPCQRLFSNYDRLEEHNKLKHNNYDRLEEHNKLTHNNYDRLEEHNKLKHNNCSSYICCFCHKVLHTLNDLLKHTGRHKIMHCACDVCTTSRRKKSSKNCCNVVENQQVTQNELNYQCVCCKGKTFPTIKSLRSHMAQVHKVKLCRCITCGNATLTSKQSFCKHFLRVHGIAGKAKTKGLRANIVKSDGAQFFQIEVLEKSE